MKINNIQINGFGKLKDETLAQNIYGQNFIS